MCGQLPRAIHALAHFGRRYRHRATRVRRFDPDQTLKLWDTATWRERRTFTDPTADAWRVAFHPDGRRLAWGGTDGTIKVADADTGALVRTQRGHTSWVPLDAELHRPAPPWRSIGAPAGGAGVKAGLPIGRGRYAG